MKEIKRKSIKCVDIQNALSLCTICCLFFNIWKTLSKTPYTISKNLLNFDLYFATFSSSLIILVKIVRLENLKLFEWLLILCYNVRKQTFLCGFLMLFCILYFANVVILKMCEDVIFSHKIVLSWVKLRCFLYFGSVKKNLFDQLGRFCHCICMC